ncbi:acid phosphatase type 7 [Hetaerina americana]|uniref:acid phosphatase type 7 n=1 Tax=Hetaerina americana TaxID=62018 RepID=UPI003A7F2EC4
MKTLIFLLFVPLATSVVHNQPEQIHISFGDKPSEMYVTWSTLNDTEVSVVEYGIGGLIKRAINIPKLFIDGGPEKRRQYIHKVKLEELQPGTKYMYHCGSELGWSSLYSFVTMKDGVDWSPYLAVYGDMGNINAQSLPRLQEETQRGMYDAIIHVGDFAYDMNTENAEVGDEFMKQIESIAAYLPYMTCPGNHEEAYNFSNYKARFSMPGDDERMYYSFNMGPIHFISVSTEGYYFLNYGLKSVVKQYYWLENDLKEANKPENRKLRPWIITFGHRPMYCSNWNEDDCTFHQTMVRVGLPFLNWFGLEDLFYDYGVDLEIWAHEHSYERLWPVYNYTVYNGSMEEPYRNPGAPVHITTGSAGCQEGRDPFRPKLPEWSALRIPDYGYSRLKVYNATHLYMEQVSDDKEGEIVDRIWLIKDHHGSYLKR